MNKYNARITEIDGFRFDSKLEAALYQQLKILLVTGEIENLQRQVTVHLSDANIPYRVDFVATEPKSGAPLYFEAKGMVNGRWPTIKRLWRFYGPGRLEVWGGCYRRLTLMEVVIPVKHSQRSE